MPPTQGNGEFRRSLDKESWAPMDPAAVADPPTNTPAPATSGRIIYLQVLMGVIANLGSLSPGMSMGFSAIALPALTNPENSFHLDLEQASWFASLSAVTMPIGCVLCGPAIDRFGRRAMLVSLNVPCLLGWLLMAGAAATADPGLLGLSLLFTGRALTGLAAGMASSAATIYIAEMAESAKMRSVMVTWTSVFIAAGVLLVYLLGALLPRTWWLIAILCGLPALVALLATLFLLPESPVWLLARGRSAAASRALQRLRGEQPGTTPTSRVEREMDALRSAPRSTAASPWATISPKRPDAYRPLLVMNGYFLFQQASGVFVVVFYAVDVARHAAGVTVDGYMASVLIGVTRLILTIVVSVLSGRVGRRPASLASGIVMAGAMAGLSLHLVLGGVGGAGVSIALLVAYIAAATCGFLTLPWAMLAEVFPSDVRGTASGITTCFAYLVSFAMLKSYPGMLLAMGAHGLFLCYAILSLAGTIFLFFFLPETKGKSVQEIAEFFKGNPLNRNSEVPGSVALHAPRGAGGVNATENSSPELPLLAKRNGISIVTKSENYSK